MHKTVCSQKTKLMQDSHTIKHLKWLQLMPERLDAMDALTRLSFISSVLNYIYSTSLHECRVTIEYTWGMQVSRHCCMQNMSFLQLNPSIWNIEEISKLMQYPEWLWALRNGHQTVPSSFLSFPCRITQSDQSFTWDNHKEPVLRGQQKGHRWSVQSRCKNSSHS